MGTRYEDKGVHSLFYSLKMFVFLFICFLTRCILFSTAQVGSRLIELLVQTAYIQPPSEPESDQSQDGGPDIRPAFVHSFRTMKEAA